MFPRSTVSSFTWESHTDAQRSFRCTSSCALGGAAWMCVSEFWRSGACCGGASAFCRAPELWQHFQIQQIQTHVQTIQQKNQTHLIRILVMSVSLFACVFYFWSILYRFCLFSFLCVHAHVCALRLQASPGVLKHAQQPWRSTIWECTCCN